MAIEHRNITDPNIHEPKGVGSAANETAYIANGTGSGNWLDLSPLLALRGYIFLGTGTPESTVTAPIGAIFLRTNGGAGTTLYVKESGTGNTGWVGK